MDPIWEAAQRGGYSPFWMKSLTLFIYYSFFLGEILTAYTLVIGLYSLLRKELDNTMVLVSLIVSVSFYVSSYNLVDDYSYVGKLFNISQSIAFSEEEYYRIVEALVFNFVRNFSLTMVHCVFTWKCFSPLVHFASHFPLFDTDD